MTTQLAKVRADVLEALEPTMTKAQRKARDKIIAALEPLPTVDKLRALAAASVMLGHYELAGDMLERLVAMTAPKG